MGVFVARLDLPRASLFPPLRRGGFGGVNRAYPTPSTEAAHLLFGGCARRAQPPRNCVPGRGSAATTPPDPPFARGRNAQRNWGEQTACASPAFHRSRVKEGWSRGRDTCSIQS